MPRSFGGKESAAVIAHALHRPTSLDAHRVSCIHYNYRGTVLAQQAGMLTGPDIVGLTERENDKRVERHGEFLHCARFLKPNIAFAKSVTPMLPWVKKFLRRNSTARPAMGGLVLRPLHERDLKTADS